jgi:chloramphenicol-sensitive protein RarD
VARGAALAAIASYTIWGLLPLYLNAVAASGPSALEIVAHCAAWAAPWAGLLVIIAGQGRQVRAALKSPRTLGLLAASALAIAGNWSLFVWAVSHGHVLEASLGYYINPLINMAVGAVLFRERLDRVAQAAIVLAGLGVAAQTFALGHLPFIALGLAVSFTLYGLIRKQVTVDAQSGLFIECLALLFPAVGYILWLQAGGAGHFLTGPKPMLLLMLAGPATVAPLALFVWSARRLPLSAIAFMQFIGPTLQFFLGVEGGEPLTPLRIASFGLIWAGVALFAHGAWRASRRAGI